MAVRDYPTSIRLQRDQRKHLLAEARRNKRSLSAEIAFILQEWLEQKRFPPAAGLPPQSPLMPAPAGERTANQAVPGVIPGPGEE